jgi:CTP synthase (UTP-ammonia lyase)
MAMELGLTRQGKAEIKSAGESNDKKNICTEQTGTVGHMELYNLKLALRQFYFEEQVEVAEVGGTWSTRGEKRNAYKN